MFLPPFELLPPEEEERLLTLSEYDIYHSLREPLFDKVVSAATAIFKVPISLISLIGADQVAYKASVGLPDLSTQLRQQAICAQVVRHQRAVVFTDLAQPTQKRQLTQACYADVQRQRLHFYAGVPLRMANGQIIGVLCLIDRRPRTLSKPAMHVLEQLAHLVERAIVVRHAFLKSPWLGEESWLDVQAYVIRRLQELALLVNDINQAAGCNAVTLAPATLQAVVGQLNDLGSVLAEPLPGFA